MTEAFICEGLRSPIGRFGGMLAVVRPDDLLAQVMQALLAVTGWTTHRHTRCYGKPPMWFGSRCGWYCRTRN